MLEASSPAFGEQDNVSSSDFYIFKHFVRSDTKHTVILTLLTFSETQTARFSCVDDDDDLR